MTRSGVTAVVRCARGSARTGAASSGFGQVEEEVLRMPGEASAGLEEALLETRHGPALNRPWEVESALEVPEVVRDDRLRATVVHLAGSGDRRAG